MDDDGNLQGQSPGIDTVTLTETAAGSGIFASKALMLVADDVDNAQFTNTGLPGASSGGVGIGTADHRLRRAALGDITCYSYTPAATGSTKQTFSIPIFGGPEPVKEMTVQVANCYHQSSDQYNVSPQTDATVQAIENSVKSHLAVAGINVNFAYRYNSTTDHISIFGPDIGGVDLANGTEGSSNSTGDQTKIANIVKAAYPGAASNTIFLILIKGFKSSTSGQPASTIGGGFCNGSTPCLHCCFVGFVGTLASSSTTCVAPHELTHELTDPTSDYNLDYGDTDPESGNHYGGLDYFPNLIKAGAADPSPGSLIGSKRLWDDSNHKYVHIPIINQIDFMRSSALLQ